MKKKDKTKFMQETGTRLRKLREALGCTREEMAESVGYTESGYAKNELGVHFPGIFSLSRLSKKFDVSMDWLLFGKGPMYYKSKETEKKVVPRKEEDSLMADLEKVMPDVRELLGHMKQDPKLRHEVLLNFYKYKENKKPEEPDEIS